VWCVSSPNAGGRAATGTAACSTIGIREPVALLGRDTKPRTRFTSLPRVHLGAGGEHMLVNRSGGEGSGSSGGGSGGLSIHFVMKEISSSNS
jgi:hypothetical protein